MAAEDHSRKDEVVATELPAPAGWAKKIVPKKGGTPQRSEVAFVSPTGEEIKTKRQLDQYLKSHPGGAAASEFDWAAGDTPRRSARLSEKSKAVETSAIQSPTKKQKRSATKRGTANEKSNANDAEGEATADKDDTADKEPKENPDAEITDAKDTAEGEPVVTDQTPSEKPGVEKKAAGTEPPTDDAKSNAKESNDTTNTDTKIEDFNNIKNIEEAKEATPSTYAKIEDSNNIKIVEEAKETTPSTQNHESKDAVHIEKKTPVETSDTKEKQVDNNGNKDLVFQESGTGN